MMTVLLTAVAVLFVAVGVFAFLFLWQKLSAVHLRIHRLEHALPSLHGELMALAGAALRHEARTRLGVEANGHSQHGEDFFLWQRLGFSSEGTYIEIGAYDGVSLSNSYFFEKIGWRGLLVEAHPDLVARCRASRPDALIVHAALGNTDGGTATFSMVRGGAGLDTLSFSETNEMHRQRVVANGGRIESTKVPARTLSSVMAEHGISNADWVSIDVEGAELDVLMGAGLETFRPRLLLVEDNSNGQDKCVADYLRRYGYRRSLTIGCNDLYERISQ